MRLFQSLGHRQIFATFRQFSAAPNRLISTSTRMCAAATWAPPAQTTIPRPPAPIRDIHSCANVDELKPIHLYLDWQIDWENKRIHGSVQHELEAQRGTNKAVFDTSYLDIHQVQVNGQTTSYELGPRRGPLGEPLHVTIGACKAGERVTVKIAYSTTNQCTALGWLTAEQTHAKKTPFLYSQCQAIHARSLLPCMDTPSRKITYSAQVTSTIPVLMSALQQPQQTKSSTIYKFHQPVPIPVSYTHLTLPTICSV